MNLLLDTHIALWWLADEIQQLPVKWNHAEQVRRLPMIHRDPFDRLLIAQAMEERLVLATTDETIPTYAVHCLVN